MEELQSLINKMVKETEKKQKLLDEQQELLNKLEKEVEKMKQQIHE